MRIRILLVMALLAGGSAQAATLRVPEDYASLLAAVDSSAIGDSILVGPGTWSDRETRVVPGSSSQRTVRASAFLKAGITIIGTAGSGATVFVGDPGVTGTVSQFFEISSDVSGPPVIIEGLTLRGADSTYVALISTSHMDVELRDCVIEDCGTAIVMTLSELRMSDCVVKNNDGALIGLNTIETWGVGFDFENCLFEGNTGSNQTILGMQVLFNTSVRIVDCRFIANTTYRVVTLNGMDSLEFRDNWFESNVNAGLSGSCMAIDNCVGSIEGNTFVQNSMVGSSGSGIIRIGGAGPTDVVGNTLYGSLAPAGSKCAGISLGLTGPFDFRSNIIAGCEGGPAVRRGATRYQPTNGCNVFWDNAAGNYSEYVRQLTDLELDPQFCDPLAMDFTVAVSSPCLAQNNVAACGTIGAHGAGCPSTGVIINGLVTQPPGLVLTEDGVDLPTPTHHAWQQGSTHSIAAPTPQAGPPGERYAFAAWSDSGANAHQVVIPGSYTEFTASFDTEFLMTKVIQGGDGVIVGDDWIPDGATRTITAVPDPGFEFVIWGGSGPGVYTGTDNPASVTPTGPISEWANFANSQYELTMVADGGGAMTPLSGPLSSFEEIEIAALPATRSVFRSWIGTGNGSYTGLDSVATITMLEPITQTAHFEEIAYEVTLSLSDTDPNVSTGSPIGLGSVYLWLDCGTAGGISTLQADVVGSMNAIVFTPAAGILNAGSSQQLNLVTASCVTGPALLGEFTVLPPGEGSLCLTGTTATNCALPADQFAWPEDLKVTGVQTDGGVPCSFGRGCNETTLSGSTPVGAPPPIVVRYPDELIGSFPNPFVQSTSIRYSLERSTRVTLSVFDVSGRRIRDLVSGDRPAGSHEVAWGGRDANGQMVSSGIFFVRMVTDDYTDVQRLVLLR